VATLVAARGVKLGTWPAKRAGLLGWHWIPWPSFVRLALLQSAGLDRGYGKPVQTIDAMLFTRKLNELSIEELREIEAKLVQAAATPLVEHRPVDELHLDAERNSSTETE
jgi:hypothetical protein